MKNLLIIAFSIGIFACGSTKETSTDQSKTQIKPVETELINGTTSGIVKDMRKTDGCDFVIAVTLDGSEVLLEPLALDEQYKEDGKAVQLVYTASRRASKCMGTMPITIEKIK